MDNTLKPIEDFVQQGLAQRFQQLFNVPLAYSNAPDKRAAAAKLLQRGLKYPFAFASVSSDGITEGSYRPHALWRKGVVSGISSDSTFANRLNLIPTTTEYEITVMSQGFDELNRFKKYWLMGSIQNALKFSVLYGVVQLDVHVRQERRIVIPQREAGLNEPKEYILTTSLSLDGYMSPEELAKTQAVVEIESTTYINTDDPDAPQVA